VVVERAIVLAAGRGNRLGMLTTEVPKPMLNVGGVPLVNRIVSSIAAIGIRSLVVVTGYLADSLERRLAASSPLPVAFIRQEERDGTAGALRLAQRAVGNEPFLLSWGDIATDPRHFADVADAWRPELAAAIGVNHIDDVGRLAAVVFDDDQRISAVVEKPEGEPPSRWNSSGLMVFGPQIWRAVHQIDYSARGELEVPDAINRLIADGELLEAVPLTGPWFDIGTESSLRAAQRAFTE
jgi:dTDP-glucose pyrophosphorylase